MKYRLPVLIIFSLCFSATILAQDDSEIKVKDLNQQNLNAVQGMGQGSNATISPEQMAELQKQMATLKDKQEESKKLLEELDQE